MTFKDILVLFATPFIAASYALVAIIGLILGIVSIGITTIFKGIVL